MSERIVGWAVKIMNNLGEPGAGLLIALENIFPPIPSEVILPLVGFTASQGNFNIVYAVLWATIGSTVGALVLYYLGRAFGREHMRTIAVKMPLVKVGDVDKTEAWFIKYETKAVFWGRMIPVFRSFISIPAGIENMHIPTFLVLTAAGSLIWNCILIGAGYIFGENLELINAYVSIFQFITLSAVLLAIAYFVYSRTAPKG